MKIDIISDIHLDRWYSSVCSSDVKSHRRYSEFYESVLKGSFYEEGSETLIIPGDIGHSNYQNIQLLKFFKTIYKNVLVTFGNHDLYLISGNAVKKYGNSLNRLDEFKELCEKSDIKFLDGSIVDIDGFNILGGSSWYDGTYSSKVNHLYYNRSELMKHWRGYLNDPNYIYMEGFQKSFIEFANIQIEKVESKIEFADIVFTHVMPSDTLMSVNYINEVGSGYYCYNSKKYQEGLIKDKTWIFGHTHELIDKRDLFGNSFICNPLGVRNGSPTNKGILSIEVFK